MNTKNCEVMEDENPNNKFAKKLPQRNSGTTEESGK